SQNQTPIPSSRYAPAAPATTSGSPIIRDAFCRTTRKAASRISVMVSGRSGISAAREASSTAGRRGRGARPGPPPGLVLSAIRDSLASPGHTVRTVVAGSPRRRATSPGRTVRSTRMNTPNRIGCRSERVSVSEGTRNGSVKGRVLVVDDDASLAEMLTIVLRNEGFEPIWVSHGDQAYPAYQESRPDLILLDLMLPGRDGVEICRQIRSESGVPIVMLTAKSDTIDVVAGLEAAADDYVAKPFKAKGLVARIKTRLRRQLGENESETLRIGDLTIKVDGHSVERAGKPIQLTPLEFDLLL